MAFKRLTSEGKDFIRFVCKGTGNSKISGKKSYNLSYNTNPEPAIYTANAFNEKGDQITTNEQLGEALIFWFNDYCEIYQLDANIIAAQTYLESSYALWAYAEHPSSAQGLSQFLSSSLYDVAIGQISLVNSVLPQFTDDEIDKLTLNITKPKQQNSYIYKVNNSAVAIAKDNRLQFFQNIINNPNLLIKAQCRFMKSLSERSANVAASALFGYSRGFKYVKDTYTKTVTAGKNGTSSYGDGLKYVKRVFEILGKKNDAEPKGYWFGYGNIDFTFDSFTADVKSTNNQ